MSLKDEFGQHSRRRDRPRTPKGLTSYFGAEARKGVPIQCQYCSGQTFRRSTLRSEDLSEIFLMRYPRSLPSLQSTPDGELHHRKSLPLIERQTEAKASYPGCIQSLERAFR